MSLMQSLGPFAIQTMSAAEVARVQRLEAMALQQPQIDLPTDHRFHAGMYARTIMVPAGVMITGALIAIPTILIVSGTAIMYGEGGPVELTGYNVLAGSAGRKQAFVAVTDTYLTMLFPTEARTVEAAEAEFTAEADLLLSRREGAGNHILLTGE